MVHSLENAMKMTQMIRYICTIDKGDDTMRCKNCGYENEEGLYICQNCGSPL